MSIPLIPFSVYAQTNQLTGTLNLPEGIVPTTQDLVFLVQTEQLDQFELDGTVVSSSTSVTIPILSSSANFSLPLRDFDQVGLAEAERRLKFDCISGCSNIAITTTGYWGGIQGVVGNTDAQVFDSALAQSITLNLERADLFRGVISLPSGVIASGNEVFKVNVVGSQFTDPPSFSQVIQTQEGQQNWAFFVGAPPSQTGGSWSLSLECENCLETIPAGPYYPSTGAGDPLTVLSGERFFYLKNRSYSNIRMTLPEPPKERAASTPLQGVLLFLLDTE